MRPGRWIDRLLIYLFPSCSEEHGYWWWIERLFTLLGLGGMVTSVLLLSWAGLVAWEGAAWEFMVSMGRAIWDVIPTRLFGDHPGVVLRW